jgi:hypothetical protein
MAEDKVNIGLSIEASKIADILEETGYFDDKLTIAKFALAYAVRNGLDDNLAEYKVGEAGGTKWNIGSVDNDQYLRDLIVSLYPDSETPYRIIEALMNKGLQSIGAIIAKEGLSKISKLM